LAGLRPACNRAYPFSSPEVINADAKMIRNRIKTGQLSGPHDKKSETLRIIFWMSLTICLFISILDLTGWITGIPWLKSMGSYWPPMKIVTALCFIITSSALAILFLKRPPALRTAFPVISGILLVFVSLLTVIGWFFFKGHEHEALFTTFPVFSFFLSSDKRMAILTAFIFLMTGIILILLSSDKKIAANAAHAILLPVAIAVYLIPASYLLKAYPIHDFFGAPAALNTGLAFSAVCAAIFAMGPDTWLIRVFTSPYSGGIMARKMIPWFIVLPVVIGWLIIRAEKTDLLGTEVGHLLENIIYTFCFIILVWFTSKSVNKADKKRQDSDEGLKRSYDELEERVTERTSELTELNKALDREITEREKTEELLKAERTRINDILEIIPAYIILLTPDYYVSYSNRFFRERFGESNGNRCYEFLFNRSEPCEICETYRTLKENKPQKWEWTGPDKRIYSIYDFLYHDIDGTLLIMEMGIDITDQKKAEANLVALNAELEERVTKRTSELSVANERLSILSRTSSQLLTSNKPQEIINSLCKGVMKFLDCQVYFNYLILENSEKLHLDTYSGISDKTAGEIEWLNFGESVCGIAAKDGTRIILEEIPKTRDPRADFVKSLGIKAFACHPLISNNNVIGALSFGTSTRTKFSKEDLSLMNTVAEQVAVAMARVRGENLLKKSEERYRKLLENSPSACLVVRDDTIILLNSAAQELLGVGSPEEVIGESPLRFFHQDYHKIIRERMKKITKGEMVEMVEEKITRADGTIRDIEVISVEINDAEGLAFQVIMNDITERKLAEKELFDTKNYLENLIDYANAPIIVWDQENRIRVFNHAFERLTGYTSGEVEGKKLDLLFPESTMAESVKMIMDAVTRNWETIEIPILTKTNEIRVVLWNSAKVYDNERKTFSTIAQGHDITEKIKAEKALKESKVRLEIAMENGKTGTWEWDIRDDSFWIDERMEKMLGLKKGVFENNFNSFEKSIHEEDILHMRKDFQMALKKDKPLDTVFRISHGSGESNYISTKALVEKENGLPVKMSGVCFDITEMKKGAEKALFRLNEDLLRSNKELEQFAYVASHDLQEPLRMVSGFTQLLARRYGDKLDQDAHEFINYAVEGAARMQLLINDLLEYSRIGTRGKAFTSVYMQNVLGKAIFNLHLKILEKNALVTNDDLPEIVADEGQMVQMMQNLIGNALKFCRDQPMIHISAIEKDDHFLFTVKDNGIGIESQYFNKIFQIFQRLHPRDEYGGTGIGLAICKRIAERHGGNIWVESRPGKGSTFYFTILKR
jgi:PAS domain S-box-containing protein